MNEINEKKRKKGSNSIFLSYFSDSTRFRHYSSKKQEGDDDVINGFSYLSSIMASCNFSALYSKENYRDFRFCIAKILHCLKRKFLLSWQLFSYFWPYLGKIPSYNQLHWTLPLFLPLLHLQFSSLFLLPLLQDNQKRKGIIKSLNTCCFSLDYWYCKCHI